MALILFLPEFFLLVCKQCPRCFIIVIFPTFIIDGFQSNLSVQLMTGPVWGLAFYWVIHHDKVTVKARENVDDGTKRDSQWTKNSHLVQNIIIIKLGIWNVGKYTFYWFRWRIPKGAFGYTLPTLVCSINMFITKLWNQVIPPWITLWFEILWLFSVEN